MIVNNIKRKCKELGISINQLAEELGLSAGTIYRWDDNKPSVDKVALVAKRLGVTVEDLLYGKDSV